MDYSKPYPGPVIADVFVSTTQTDDWYWTGTDFSADTTVAWGVDFDYGVVGAYFKSYSDYVRCVRGN